MGAYGPAPREEATLTSGIAELLGILSPHALHPDGEWSFAEGPRRMLTGRCAGAGALLFQPGLEPLRADRSGGHWCICTLLNRSFNCPILLAQVLEREGT